MKHIKRIILSKNSAVLCMQKPRSAFYTEATQMHPPPKVRIYEIELADNDLRRVTNFENRNLDFGQNRLCLRSLISILRWTISISYSGQVTSWSADGAISQYKA